MRTDRALKKAVDELHAALVKNPDLEPNVAERVERLEDFRLQDGILYFTLERHPHIFGRESKGMESSGYFIIVQRYAFDPQKKTIELLEEECKGMEANVYRLVADDVCEYLQASGMDDFKDCASEEEVRRRATELAEEPVGRLSDTLLITPNEVIKNPKVCGPQWDRLCKKFKDSWREEYVDQVVEQWLRDREWEDTEE